MHWTLNPFYLYLKVLLIYAPVFIAVLCKDFFSLIPLIFYCLLLVLDLIWLRVSCTLLFWDKRWFGNAIGSSWGVQWRISNIILLLTSHASKLSVFVRREEQWGIAHLPMYTATWLSLVSCVKALLSLCMVLRPQCVVWTVFWPVECIPNPDL